MLEHEFQTLRPDFRISIDPTEIGDQYKVYYQDQEFLFCHQEDAWRFISYICASSSHKVPIAKQRALLQRALRTKTTLENAQLLAPGLSLV